jgi:spermidine synthase
MPEDNQTQVLYDGETELAHYIVADTVYNGRPARVLYSATRSAAQSGIATDNNPQLLFDYNQRILEIARGQQPKRILLIGGGAFTLPIALLAELSDTHITVVELDGDLPAIAQRFFGLQPDPRLAIVHGSGEWFIANTREQFDLIIIDAFMDAVIPQALRTIQVATYVRRALSFDGVVAINVIAAYYGRRGNVLHELYDTYRELFSGTDIFVAGRSLSLWIPQNFLLVASAHPGQQVSHWLGYGPLRPL